MCVTKVFAIDSEIGDLEFKQMADYIGVDFGVLNSLNDSFLEINGIEMVSCVEELDKVNINDIGYNADGMNGRYKISPCIISDDEDEFCIYYLVTKSN